MFLKIATIFFGLLMLAGVVMVVLPTPDGPTEVCAQPGQPSSGFVSEETGCPLTIESFEEIRDWRIKSNFERAPVRGVGIMTLLVAVPAFLIFVILWLTIGRTPKGPKGPQPGFPQQGVPQSGQPQPGFPQQPGQPQPGFQQQPQAGQHPPQPGQQQGWQ